jgi:hypothetical protein
MQKLTVKYRFNGSVVDEIREGFRFRWTPSGTGWAVTEETAPGRRVWWKLYTDVITIELDCPDGG